MYKRIFTFGCSYTEYKWPTWATIIAHDLELPFENWAISGSGNFAIQSRLSECDLKNNLNEDDLVMVLWSGWNREDRFDLSNNGWQKGGYIFNNPYYDQKFLEKYWRLENDVMKNISVMHTVRKAYDKIIKFEGEMISSSLKESETHFNTKKYVDNYIKAMLTDFESKNPAIPSFGIIQPDEWHDLFDDIHPSIEQHLKFVIDAVYPKLGLKIKQSTIDNVKEVTKHAMNIRRERYRYADDTSFNRFLMRMFNQHGFYRNLIFRNIVNNEYELVK